MVQPHLTKEMLCSMVYFTLHICVGVSSNWTTIMITSFFPVLYLKKLNYDNWFAKIAQDLTDNYQIYDNHPYENQIIIIIENLEP